MPILRLPVFFLLLIFLSGWMTSCYEPTEGCLDINATNYQVDADDPCAECCTFPALTLSVEHLAGLPNDTVSFRYGVNYPSEVDPLDSFMVDRARFFISNLYMVTDTRDTLGVIDSITLSTSSGQTVTVWDNFAKTDRDIFQASTLGTLISEGSVTEVNFTLGLEEFLLQSNVSGFPAGHPLNSSDTLLYDDNTGYIPFLLIIRKDTMPSADSIAFRFSEPAFISLPLEQPFDLERGFDVRITLRIDYMKWFSGVDFLNDSEQTMYEKINNNLSNVFSVTEVEME